MWKCFFSLLKRKKNTAQGVASEILEPYRSIVDLPFDDHGWFFNSRQLEHILAKKRPKIGIEVGSWLGSSTRFIATNMPEKATLYAVDTWKGSPEEAIHMQDQRLPYLYQLFLSNVKHAKLTHKIIPIRMESVEAAHALNIMADFIYIDAAHDKLHAKQDILAWYPHLKSDGFFCGDDWDWPEVKGAVIECAIVLNKQVKADENFWWYE